MTTLRKRKALQRRIEIATFIVAIAGLACIGIGVASIVSVATGIPFLI